MIQEFPIDAWLPDAGSYDHAGLTVCKSVVPYGNKYIPDSKLVVRTNPTLGVQASPITAHHSRFQGNAGSLIVYGTSSGLYGIEPNDTPWSDNYLSGDFGAITVGPEGWSIVSFGENILATPGLSHEILAMRSGDSEFSDRLQASSQQIKCKFLAVWGSRVAAAYIANTGTAGDPDPNPYLVWLSSTDNGLNYGTQATAPGDRTGFHRLIDGYGAITGLAGGAKWGALFKRDVVYRVDYQDSFGVHFEPVGTEGCIYPQSYAWATADDLYYWGPNGPCALRVDHVEDLAKGRVARSLVDAGWPGTDSSLVLDPAAPLYSVRAVYDTATATVSWFYPTADGGTAQLVYSIASGRMSFLPRNGSVGPGGAYDSGVDCVLSYPNDSATFLANKEVAVFSTAANGTTQLYQTSQSGVDYFSGSLCFSSPFISFPDRVKVKAVRVGYSRRTDASVNFPSIRVKVRVANDTGDTPSEHEGSSETDRGVDDRGFVRVECLQGRLIQVRVEFVPESVARHPSSTVADFPDTLQVEFEKGGGR
jgi:hypothetical protein